MIPHPFYIISKDLVELHKREQQQLQQLQQGGALQEESCLKDKKPLIQRLSPRTSRWRPCEETPLSCPPFESFISFDERFTTVRDDLKPFIESLGTHIWNKFIRDVERLYRSNRSLDSLGVSESISCNNLLAKIFPMSTISKYQQNAYLLFEKWKGIFAEKSKEICLELCYIPGLTAKSVHNTSLVLRPDNAERYLGFMLVLSPAGLCDKIRQAERRFFSENINKTTIYRHSERVAAELTSVDDENLTFDF